MEVPKQVNTNELPMNTQASFPGLAPDPVPMQPSLPGIPYAAGTVPFKAIGKQVLKDDVHYADAVDPDAADCIVRAMNAEVVQSDWTYLLNQIR